MGSPGPNTAPAPELEARRALYQGFGNALGQAVEIVVTPLLFTLLGVWLDATFDLRPLLTVTLALAGLLGVAVKAYYRYAEKMAAEDEGKPWNR